MKYLVVGGVAGGATATARLRRIDENAEIILFEKGSYISYANCGLPYYIGGVISDREQLFVQTPETFGKRFNVDVRIESEVTNIFSDRKEIEVTTRSGKVYTESYDKLLLSPGAKAFIPPLEGINGDRLFSLRNVKDTDTIKQYVETHTVNKVAVIGAGFIGLEMAENMHELGAKVSIVEMSNQVMAPVDYSIASFLHGHLIDKDVDLYLEERVEKFQENANNTTTVIMASGRSVTVDMVILSIGVRPEVGLAQKAGIQLGELGGIKVDDHLETNIKDIYAVGDAIEFPNPVSGIPYFNYLANPANRQGRIVADNMVYGNKTSYEGAIGTAIAKVFDMTVGVTGLSGKYLKRMEIPYCTTTIHSNSHAGYYPDALPLTVKLTFDPKTGIIFGGQVVGYDGVDKRVDQIAVLIKKEGTVYDLMKLEHAYAPPFSSAKDPIAIAGYTANNIISGKMPVIYWKELYENLKEFSIFDVRTQEEFAFGHIQGAINIPLDDIRERITEFKSDKPIVIYCAVGLRGYLATNILIANGYKVRNLSGGYKTYFAATEPVQKGQGDCCEPTTKVDAASLLVNKVNQSAISLKVDACGLQCPGPIMKVKESMDSIKIGEKVEITSTDAGFARDADSWCESTGNKLVNKETSKGKYTVVIEKGGEQSVCAVNSVQKDKTLIMFSDDFDKAIATFILANGAAATGQRTTIFFTFWGLNLLKKAKKPSVKKDIFAKMFSWMMPSHSKKLALSKMNFLGMGTLMMRYIMKRKGVDSLESLRQQALDNGVEFIACQMSMDIMGVQKEELLDEATIGGVATYMNRADKANVNLFI